MYQLRNLLHSRQINEQSRPKQRIPRDLVPISSPDSIIHLQRDYKRLQLIETLRNKLNEDIIGSDAGFWGPFGWRQYSYVDHTASGKAVKCIENFVEKQVLPHYANTHTTVSHTSLQTTVFRNEARDAIKQSVGALDDDEVIFCGSGATAAIHKLLHAITYPKTRKLIVFIGPFEHHSNILPWREAALKVIQVPLSLSTGQVDMSFLRQKLQRLQDNKKARKNQLVIGCFSAGSNITGAVTDDIEITKLLHEFGALAFWDYAAAAPHVEIKMNPMCGKSRQCDFYCNEENNGRHNSCAASKDAIFFSGHKFLGGPSTPGILVVKRHVLQNPIPHAMGGGTVLFTTRMGHQYLKKPHEREEGGTPDIIGSIRFGLVLRLRNMVGIQNIVEIEAAFCRKVLDEWTQVPEIQILGYNNALPRLPCISFMIQHLPSGFFLHYNFVVALLNDLFGIQCRGGCMCAGPYAQVLLGIDDNLASLYEASLKNESKSGGILLKPGFVRISLNFHSSLEEVDFVIKAVRWVARNGWKMMPLYRIDWETASFIFNGDLQQNHVPSLSSLSDLSVGSHKNNLFRSSSKFTMDTGNLSKISKWEYFKQAQYLLSSMLPKLTFPINTAQDTIFLNSLKTKKHLRKLRWFMLPSESVHFQLYYAHYYPGHHFVVPLSLQSSRPFQPVTFSSAVDGSPNHPQNKPVHHTASIPGELSLAWRKHLRFNFFKRLEENTTKLSYCEFDSNHIKSLNCCSSGKQHIEKDKNTLCSECRRKSMQSQRSSGFEDDDELNDINYNVSD